MFGGLWVAPSWISVNKNSLNMFLDASTVSGILENPIIDTKIIHTTFPSTGTHVLMFFMFDGLWVPAILDFGN